MNCPNCRAVMTTHEYEEIPIHVCDGCRGVWVIKDNLSLITRRRDEQIDPAVLEDLEPFDGLMNLPDEDRSRSLNCPICDKKLDLTNYGYSSGIIVDHCPNEHGVYLDDSELHRVQAWMEKYDAHLDSLDGYYKAIARRAEGRSLSVISSSGRSVGAFIYGLPGALYNLGNWLLKKKNDAGD